MNIVHCLMWKLNDVNNNLEYFKEKGFDTVLISPIHSTKAHISSDKDWWLLYQPTRIASFTNDLGNLLQLQELCKKAKKLNMHIMADLVLRHVASCDYDKTKPHRNVTERYCNIRNSYIEGNMYDYMSRVNDCFGMPMTNYKADDFGEEIEAYMNMLEYVIGVDYFRIDMGKHFDYTEDYKLKEVFRKHKCAGECIEISESEQYQYLFDSCMYRWLIVNPCEMHAVIGNDHYITFIESHDTYNSFGYTRDISAKERAERFKMLPCNCNKLLYLRPYDDVLNYL